MSIHSMDMNVVNNNKLELFLDEMTSCQINFRSLITMYVSEQFNTNDTDGQGIDKSRVGDESKEHKLFRKIDFPGYELCQIKQKFFR